MQRICLFCSLLFLTFSAFAQDCETFSAELDVIKSSVQQAPEKKLADVDFLYTLDKRLITESELREKCKEGITIEKIIYRRVEGETGAQPLVRLVSNVDNSSTKVEPAMLLKWTFVDKASVPKGIYDHPYFHQEREDDGQPVFIFWIKKAGSIDLVNDLNPDVIESINVWKDALHLQQYDAEKSAGIVEIILKEDQDYIDFLGLDE